MGSETLTAVTAHRSAEATVEGPSGWSSPALPALSSAATNSGTNSASYLKGLVNGSGWDDESIQTCSTEANAATNQRGAKKMKTLYLLDTISCCNFVMMGDKAVA